MCGGVRAALFVLLDARGSVGMESVGGVAGTEKKDRCSGVRRVHRPTTTPHTRAPRYGGNLVPPPPLPPPCSSAALSPEPDPRPSLSLASGGAEGERGEGPLLQNSNIRTLEKIKERQSEGGGDEDARLGSSPAGSSPSWSSWKSGNPIDVRWLKLYPV